MSLSLGHKYWVQLLATFTGDLKECLDYMSAKGPGLDTWFELRPDIKVIKGHAIHTGKYRVDLVKDGKNDK